MGLPLAKKLSRSLRLCKAMDERGSQTRIRLEGLRKRYGSLMAVKDVDLEVEEGDFVVIVGPSGCGKSTTLRMIAGLEPITAGELYFDDELMNDVEPKNRNVAMVFQNYALYPHMTARRNMAFGMQSNSSFTDEEIESRIREAAETLDITEHLDRKPKQLSGGERQRVAIGRALVRDPDVLLLDEPLSNLDAKLRIQMRTELAALHEELRTTTVYVTHDQTEAMTLGDRVVVMDDGKIQQVAPPQRLYDYPANQFVAGFIGSPSMNTLPVRVRSGGDGWVVTPRGDADVEIDLPGAASAAAVTEGEAVFGIRPEDIHLSESGGEAGLAFPLDVRMTEPLGDVLLVYGDLAGTEFTVQLDAHEPVERGDSLTLYCDPERLHLFDAEDGEAVYHSGQASAEVTA